MKKKLLSSLFLLLLMTVMLVAMGTVAAAAESEPVAPSVGDINADGITDIADIVAVINAASGTALDPDEYPGQPDVTKDGVIDIADIVTVINIASGDTYTVTFETDGGSAVPSITQSAYTVLTEPEAPEKEGHLFGGWYTDAACTQPYTFTTMPSENLTLYAKWELIEVYTVIFRDYDGTTVREFTVRKGESVDPWEIPDELERDGYRFTGWQGSYENVMSDVVLQAEYVPQFTVRFFSGDGSLVKETSFDCGLAEYDITLPRVFCPDGYVFVGWFEAESNTTYADWNFATAVAGDVFTFCAKIVQQHTVYFVGYDDDDNEILIKTLLMADGERITSSDLPAIPERTGYSAAWDDEAIVGQEIKADTVFLPIYQVKTYKVTFLDKENGSPIPVEDQDFVPVDYGSFVLIPAIEEYQKQSEIKLFAFSHWCYADGTTVPFLAEDTGEMGIVGGRLVNITSNVTIYPVYETTIDQVIVFAHMQKKSDLQYALTLSLGVPDGCDLYSLNLALRWGRASGISGVSIPDILCLDKNKCEENPCTVSDRDTWYTYSNKAGTFDFVWNCGNGHELTTSDRDGNKISATVTVLDITFVMPNEDMVLTAEDIIFEENSYAVFGVDEDISQLDKTNVLIYYYE